MTDLRDLIARAIFLVDYMSMGSESWETSELDGNDDRRQAFEKADAVLAVLADHDAKVRAEALQEAADRIEPAPVKPENPYSYDPWDDDSVDPTNLDDVTRAAIIRGWESGSYASSVSAHMILTSMVAVTRGEAS